MTEKRSAAEIAAELEKRPKKIRAVLTIKTPTVYKTLQDTRDNKYRGTTHVNSTIQAAVTWLAKHHFVIHRANPAVFPNHLNPDLGKNCASKSKPNLEITPEGLKALENS